VGCRWLRPKVHAVHLWVIVLVVLVWGRSESWRAWAACPRAFFSLLWHVPDNVAAFRL
jgi:hypothetical protein